VMIQISQAVGASGLMHPVAAAWFPNGVFFLAGIVLLWRAQT
jgi:lipopolysaccharide export LptBFGC system permease protein LptF